MPLTLASRPWRANSLPRRGLLASVLAGMEPLASWRGLSKVIEPLSLGTSRLKMAMSVAAVSAALLPMICQQTDHPILEKGAASRPRRELGRQGQPRGVLVEDQDGLRAPAEHQIGLPIAELLAVLNGFGPVVDGLPTPSMMTSRRALPATTASNIGLPFQSDLYVASAACDGFITCTLSPHRTRYHAISCRPPARKRTTREPSAKRSACCLGWKT